MKKNSYIILALAGMLSMNSCNDDEFLPGNPSMEIKAENADALFGDSLPFTIKASDVDVPLSTLKAQLFYGEEQVSETVIRTKTSGNDYTGKIFVPYYANIPNGKATLKYILQNIHFTTTEIHLQEKNEGIVTLLKIFKCGKTVEYIRTIWFFVCLFACFLFGEEKIGRAHV